MSSPVVEVLSDERVWLHCEVLVDFRHVDVIDEVNKSFETGRSEVPACLSLERLLQHLLQHF